MSPTATSANGSSPEKTILVVGAGPVGLFTALKLAQAGLNVEVIDLLPGRSTAPRAAGYYGGALVALRKAGVYDEMLRKGYLADGLAWRALPEDDGKGGKTFGKSIARMPVLQPVLKDSPAEMYGHPELEGGMVILPQSSFAKILEDQALATGRVRIHWDTQIADIAEEGETVVATVKPATIGREEVVNTWTLRGAYLVGADGGRSAVRKLLKIQLPGHTWPERLIATDVSLFNDFVSDTPAHFVVSRPHYAVVIPLTKAVAGQATLWRYSVAIDPTDMRPDEEILSDDNLAQLYDMTMVGKRPLQYEVKRRAIYNIHQRLVTTMRRGRCLLAGDAAHLCNPMGAMGLASGILDAEAAADALAMRINEGYPDTVLDVYSDTRRQVFAFFVDPMTTQNKIRLANDPDAVEREDGFVRMLNHGTREAGMEMARQFVETWRTDMQKAAAHLRPE